jgi:hypothetical protein
MVTALCYCHDAFWIDSLALPLVHRTIGNAMASTVGVATRWSSTGLGVVGHARPRQRAGCGEGWQRSPLARPREQEWSRPS